MKLRLEQYRCLQGGGRAEEDSVEKVVVEVLALVAEMEGAGVAAAVVVGTAEAMEEQAAGD